MKSILSYSLLAAAMAAGVAYGQATTATTTPVGYVSQTLTPNQFNAVGLTLHNSAVAAGAFELTPGFGVTLTDSQLSFAPIAGRLYILEIVSGAAKGVIQEVPAASITGTTITTVQNLESLGLANGDQYKLRLAPTLEEIFGTSADSVLTRALNAGNGDNVWVPDGAGGYTKYFLHSSSSQFRIAGTTTPAINVPVVYADGLLVEKKAAQSQLVITGEVKTVDSSTVITQGFNLISVVLPAGATLKTVGLEAGLKAALNSGNADVVWVPQGNGSYIKYYRHTSNGGTWRETVANTNLPADQDVNLPTAIFVEKKDPGQVNLTLKVPASFSEY